MGLWMDILSDGWTDRWNDVRFEGWMVCLIYVGMVSWGNGWM